MAAPNRKNRLSPPLMHAFRAAHAARDATKKIDQRDESGERIIAGRRAVSRAPITENLLRREVALDLESLMNTVAFESSVDVTDFPYVRRSIINYGLPDLVHRSIDETGVDDVKAEIENTMTLFEPRLIRDSVHVARDTELDPTELKVRFVVRAELRCDPADVPVEFVADLDVEVAAVQINRL
jgi:type VI secretion system protein ImpF